MKKNSYYYIVGAATIIIGGVVYHIYKKNNYTSFLGWLFKKTTTNQSKNILFNGDSITDIDDSRGRPTGNYPLLIRKDRPDLVVDVNALGGQTTAWMLANMPKYLNKKYAKVFIYGGVNDAFNTSVKLDTTISNIQKMVDLAIGNGAKAYVILGYEPNGFMDYKKMPTTRYVTTKEGFKPLIQRYKDLQALMAKNVKNATIIPKINMPGLTADGIHPNGTGQRMIADTIKKYL